MRGTKDLGKVAYLQLAAIAVTAAIPLVTLPGLAAPFSTPKIAVLAAWIVVGGLISIFCGTLRFGFETTVQKLAGAWIALVSASALWGQAASLKALLIALLPAASFLLLTWIKPEPKSLASALVISSSVVACIALAQYLGLDPFRLAGWQAAPAGTVRMKVYATLGNPNFVAALLACIVPLAWAVGGTGVKARLLSRGAAVIMVLAILATGSRAPILGGVSLALSSLWLFPPVSRRVRIILGLAMIILLAALVAVTSVGRPVREVIQGRFFIWRVAISQASVSTLLLGDGPGSFATGYPEWETKWAASAPKDQQSLRFLGYQEHAHNDWLEVLLEQGIAGVALLLLVMFSVLRPFKAGVLQSNCAAASAVAGIAIFAGLACVDFPFHRPAEASVFWTLLAIAHLAFSNVEGSYAETVVRPSGGSDSCGNRKGLARRL